MALSSCVSGHRIYTERSRGYMILFLTKIACFYLESFGKRSQWQTLCVSGCVCACQSTCVCACLWRLEDNLGVIFLVLSYITHNTYNMPYNIQYII